MSISEQDQTEGLQAKKFLGDLLRIGEQVLRAPHYNANFSGELARLDRRLADEKMAVHLHPRVIGDEEEIALFALHKVASGEHQGLLNNRWADVARSLLELCSKKFMELVEREAKGTLR